MLGSFGVGKTSLVRRFVHNKFDEKYLTTIGVQISQKTLSPIKNSNESLKLILWDIAHIEKFDNVIKNYFRGSHAAIIVFDFSRPQTFKESDVFLKPYFNVNPKSKIIFVGNKVDLVEGDSIETEQLLQFAKKFNTSHFLTSAKTGKNVEALFSKLGSLLTGAK